MLVNTQGIEIEWGDCDPAGIVFYPRYFAYFDACTAALFHRALGQRRYEWQAAHDIVGIPMVDTRARFLVPSRYGDLVVVESSVTAFRRSSFDVQHRLLKAGELAVEAWETRVWTGRHPDDPARIQAVPIPKTVIDAFGAGA